VLALACTATVAAAQPGAGLDQPNFSPLVRAIGGFVFTLLVGGVTLALAPGYVDRVVRQVSEETFGSFLRGVGVMALVIGLAVILAMTVVGIVVAIPLLLVFAVLAIVGNALGYLSLLSAVSMLRAVAGVPFRIGSGWAADRTSTLIAAAGPGVAFVIGTVALHALSPPVRSKADADATAD